MDRKAAAEQILEIELLEAAKEAADAKCKVEEQKKQNDDKPRNAAVEQMALKGTITKTKGAFNDLVLRLRQQAEVIFEWALETNADEMIEKLGGFKDANKAVEATFTKTFTALEEALEDKFKVWDAFATATNTGK
eukprot:403869-Heterocapsa_arctica.AAC.1